MKDTGTDLSPALYFLFFPLDCFFGNIEIQKILKGPGLWARVKCRFAQGLGAHLKAKDTNSAEKTITTHGGDL